METKLVNRRKLPEEGPFGRYREALNRDRLTRWRLFGVVRDVFVGPVWEVAFLKQAHIDLYGPGGLSGRGMFRQVLSRFARVPVVIPEGDEEFAYLRWIESGPGPVAVAFELYCTQYGMFPTEEPEELRGVEG